MAVKSKCLTGDKAGIEEFLDRFDVGDVLILHACFHVERWKSPAVP